MILRRCQGFVKIGFVFLDSPSARLFYDPRFIIWGFLGFFGFRLSFVIGFVWVCFLEGYLGDIAVSALFVVLYSDSQE